MKSLLSMSVLIIFLLYPVKGRAGEEVVLASFSTSVTDQSEGVKQNISIAGERLNGAVIASGQVFSFNEYVGEGSAANGYVDGSVLYQDRLVMEPGGGLCQVSSTLFNALLMAGFSIVERHRHFQPVTYVPLGLDATIKYGKKDLRMKNTLGQDVRLRVVVSDGSLSIVLLGTARLPHNYFIETEEEEITVPFHGEEGTIRPGISVYVYRKKMTNNRAVERFLLYKDFYPPVRRP